MAGEFNWIKGNIFPLNNFMSNFKTHIDEGRIVRREDGYQITNKGKTYFSDLYNAGNRQHIHRADVEIMYAELKLDMARTNGRK